MGHPVNIELQSNSGLIDKLAIIPRRGAHEVDIIAILNCILFLTLLITLESEQLTPTPSKRD